MAARAAALHGAVSLRSSFLPPAAVSAAFLPSPHLAPSPSLCLSTVVSSALPGTKDTQKDKDRKRTSVSWGCDPQSIENGSLLQDWLTNEGLAKQKLVLNRVDSGGRGLVATQSLRQGERLLFVPSRLLIFADSEWGCAETGKIIKEAGLPEWPTLAVFLISEASRGTASRWFPYFATLPKTPSSILQWTEDEVNTWLTASPVREKALEYIRDVTETYRDLRASIFSKHPEVFSSQVYTLEAFKWAFGILFSRLVRLPSVKKLALVPWADMLNHSPQVDAFLDFDQSSGKSVVFVTDRAYQPGEQVFISYGKRPSGELLLAYGFIPPEFNAHDHVELEMELDNEDPSYEAKLTALKEQGLSSPQRFPVRKDGFPAQLLAYARLIASRASNPAQLSLMARAATEAKATANDTSDVEAMLSAEEETDAYERVLAVCENSIADYTSFLEANEESDDEATNVDSSARLSRTRMLQQLAVALCKNEQRMLFRLQYILRTDLRGLRTLPGTESMSGGAKGKAKRANGGLFNLFKWNIDILEK